MKYEYRMVQDWKPRVRLDIKKSLKTLWDMFQVLFYFTAGILLLASIISLIISTN